MPDGRYLATGSSFGHIKILSVASGKVESSLYTTDNDFVYCVNFVIFSQKFHFFTLIKSADGKYLCCGAASGYMYIFDMNNGKLLMKQQGILVPS